MRKSTFLFPVLFLLAAVFSVFSLPAWADDDPPGRVARLNFMQGNISFQPGGETDWVQASPNRPMTTGDNLWADRDARGELHIGSSTIRIGSQTGVTFLNLDDRTVQIQLAQGSLNVNVRRLDGGDDFEIDTPNLAFTLQRPGDYRVDVDADGNATTISVRSGEGQATGGGSEYHMDSGDRATFTGTDSLNYDAGQIGRPDGFDAWCRSRDDREEHSQSARYVSRDVTGYDDLDENGEWRTVPDYGAVWYPTHVAADWAPYRYGHWVWVAPWGWTWVEDEPWGFAPFHYGRWAEVGGGWCWVPGPVVVRPVYAPALVVFVGGAHFGAAISFGGGGGGVGWFPLGPREVYVPPYRTSERYVQRVNVTNTTVNVVNVTNVYNNTTVNNVHYVNQNNVRAVTVVSHDTFVNARQANTGIVRVNEQQLRGAEVQRNFTVAPVQRSVVGAGAAANSRPPAAVMQRQVVAVQTPPPPRPSFNGTPQQQSRIIRQAATMPQRGQQQSQQPMQQQQRGQQEQIQQQPTKQQPPLRGQQPTPQQQGQPPIQQQGRQEGQQQQHGQQQQQIQQQPAQQQPPLRGQQPTPQQGRQEGQQQQRGQQQQQIQPQPTQQQPPLRGQQPAPPQQGQPREQQRDQQQGQQQQHGQQQPQQRGQQQMQSQPQQQNPNVRYAPPARANDDTYRPHQFEKPQETARPTPPPQAPPPQAAPQQKNDREPPRQQQQQDRGQDSKKQGDQKDKK